MKELTVFDSLFNDLLGYVNTSANTDIDKKILVDVDSTEDGYIIKAEVPGIDQENIEINLENGILSIKAEYKEDNGSCLRSGKYRWAAKVANVDGEKISATLDKGILVINLPKAESAKARKIEIKNQ